MFCSVKSLCSHDLFALRWCSLLFCSCPSAMTSDDFTESWILSISPSFNDPNFSCIYQLNFGSTLLFLLLLPLLLLLMLLVLLLLPLIFSFPKSGGIVTELFFTLPNLKKFWASCGLSKSLQFLSWPQMKLRWTEYEKLVNEVCWQVWEVFDIH